MKDLKQYLIILLCLFAGELISKGLYLLIPGNVIGMIILLVLLLAGIVKLEDVEKGADNLIKNLSLFFVPVGAGIMMYFDILPRYALPITMSMLFSTLIVLVVTGHVTQALMGSSRKEVDKHD